MHRNGEAPRKWTKKTIPDGSVGDRGENTCQCGGTKRSAGEGLIERGHILLRVLQLLGEKRRDGGKLPTGADAEADGGFGQKIAGFYGPSDVKVYNFGLKKEFLDRYNAADVLKENHLTPEQIWEDVK